LLVQEVLGDGMSTRSLFGDEALEFFDFVDLLVDAGVFPL
jgi:hypothetical protein